MAAARPGRAPFYEPGLRRCSRPALATGRLRSPPTPRRRPAATCTSCASAPRRSAGEIGADLTCVDAAIEALLPHLRPGDVVVGKSTVPVGTAERLSAASGEIAARGASWSGTPSSCARATRSQDTLHPDRLVYGVPRTARAARARPPSSTRSTPGPWRRGTPRIVGDLATAELVKVAANSFLATKISFINAMAELCEATGADVTVLADAIGLDERIGRRFLNAGLGFGGGCLPKDIRAFMARAGELGVDQALRSSARSTPSTCGAACAWWTWPARSAAARSADAGSPCSGPRSSPTATTSATHRPSSVAEQMPLQGADVVVTDPRRIATPRGSGPTSTSSRPRARRSRGAELVLVLTEWREYRDLDPVARRRAGRGTAGCSTAATAWTRERWRAAGWTYRALGRR